MRLFLITGLILFMALPVHAKVLDVQEVTSAGGIKAWLVEDHSIPVLAIEAGWHGAGSAQDPANKQGLSRMLSNTLDEGAGDISSTAFQKELRDLSISLSFGSSRDAFTGSVKTLSKNRARALELLKLAITEPRFEADAVRRMAEANQARIRGSLSDPEWMAARILNDRVYEGHPYAFNSGGTLSSLAGISSQDLRGFHKKFIGKNNLAVAVAGDISAAELSVILDDVFGGLPEVTIEPPKDITIQNSGTIFVYEQDIPQSVIEILQPGIDSDDPRFEAAGVMNFILGSSGFGSRLTEEIREKRGLTYGIYSYFMNMDHAHGLAVSTSTKTENTSEMLRVIKAEFQNMMDTPVSEKELQDAKDYLIGSVPLSLTSTDKIAGLMLSLQLDGRASDYLDRREAQILATTPVDIQSLAKDILAPDAFTTIIVGKPSGLGDIEMIKTLPNVE